MNIVIHLTVDGVECSARVEHDGKVKEFEAVSVNGLLDNVDCYVKRIVNEAGVSN